MIYYTKLNDLTFSYELVRNFLWEQVFVDGLFLVFKVTFQISVQKQHMGKYVSIFFSIFVFFARKE